MNLHLEQVSFGGSIFVEFFFAKFADVHVDLTEFYKFLVEFFFNSVSRKKIKFD